VYSAGRSAQGGQEGWAEHHDGDGVRDRATRPNMPPSPCRRAAGSWSWADSSSARGPPKTAALGRLSRCWLTSSGQAFGGRRRRRPGRRGAPASSQVDQRCEERDVGEACSAFRSVVSVLVKFVVRSFSTNSRPALRPAACGGLPRAGSTTATRWPSCRSFRWCDLGAHACDHEGCGLAVRGVP
jgi:hypothetical protein